MTEFNGAVLQQAKIVAIISIVLNLMEQIVTSFQGPLKFIAFNADGIARQLYELSKQLQDLHVDVTLF
jgi:ABC-type enterobactin transport system permease subunit